ncbi:MAG: PhoX family phosphatase [Pseudomonadota bacterium]
MDRNPENKTIRIEPDSDVHVEAAALAISADQDPTGVDAPTREEIEDCPSNTSPNDTIGDIIADRLSRRDLMRGALAASTIGVTIHPMAMLAAHADEATKPDVSPRPINTTPSFKFTELKAGSSEHHYIAEGHNADVLIRWGDKVLNDAPDFQPDSQTPASQSKQFGYNNDFVGFIPLEGRSDHGLLVINHEYTIEELMFPGVPEQRKQKFKDMTADLVAIEMMAHGGSVVEVKREAGTWSVVENSPYARRITAETEMSISGPAAGHHSMKTSGDPTGTKVKGMINNCAGATTPWGTWLTCEENFNFYFWNKAAKNTHPDAVALKRYGIPAQGYAWGKFHDRFDIEKEPNEVNRFGWVVEIDPHDPASRPVKRTALGRFKHEGAANIVNKDGRFVVYQGDDQRFDYVYRFVTKSKVNPSDRAANKDILDQGTLYVARFNPDGTGLWLPLEFGQGPLTPASGFHSQADVLIKTRLAADLLGATKMDRPEDVEANPMTNKVYVMLTNNRRRTDEATDAANPRANNNFGHIIEIIPPAGDHAASNFDWEILVKCGDPAIAEVGATFNPNTSQDGWFGMPDNCAIDTDGRLWIATDGNSEGKTGRTDGVWAMETEGDARATSKLFYRCPVGAELCGPYFTPDMETFFVAVQHPGASADGQKSTFQNPTTRWPDFKDGTPPRPAVVAITRKGGGKIAV